MSSNRTPHWCGGSRRNDAVMRITVLICRVTELVPIKERCCLFKTRPHQGFYLMSCNYFCTPISQEENRTEKRPIVPAMVARERYIDFYLARNDFN